MKKKIISILFALIIMLTLCIIVSAEDYTEWTVSQDEKTLIIGDKTYELYTGYLSLNDKILPEEKFVYGDEYGYSDLYLKRNMENEDIMVLTVSAYSYSIERIYVNSEGKKALDSFVDKNYSLYRISSSYTKYSNTTKGWIDLLDGGTVVKLDVRSLQSCQSYYVLGYDSTGSIAHTVGAIYNLDGAYYYVNYDILPNNYFDANGNLSYRQGDVNAYKLNTAQESDMEEFTYRMDYFDIRFESDTTPSFEGAGRGFFIFIFVFVTALFGFIIPLVPVIIGTIRITKQKTKNPKRWLLMLIACTLWIVVAICLLLAIIF